MYVNISIMKPNEGYEQHTLDSMHRFGAAARDHDGLQMVTTLKDADSGNLVGLAVWDSEASARAAGPALMAAVEGDDFETWVGEMQNFRLNEV